MDIETGNDLQCQQDLQSQIESDLPDPEMALEQILSDPDVTQHWTRAERDGMDVLMAYCRLSFEPGQQRAVLHLPFSPAMPDVPEVEANPVDLFEARVRITDRQKFGTRVEVVLPKPARESQNLLIEIIASAKLCSKTA